MTPTGGWGETISDDWLTSQTESGTGTRQLKNELHNLLARRRGGGPPHWHTPAHLHTPVDKHTI